MTTGIGSTRFTREAYFLTIRMLADNYKYSQIVAAVHERFPEHRPDQENAVTYRMVWRLAHQRGDEVESLRGELNKSLTDLWIANKRQRLVALQDIYEDCNRWVPKKVIEPPKRPGTAPQGVPKPLVICEKDVTGMLSALKQAREELGVTAADKVADSLQDLVRQAEDQRGLERTVTIDSHPTEVVDYIEEAKVLELPPPARSKGRNPLPEAPEGDVDDGEGPVRTMDLVGPGPQTTPT